MDNLIITFLHIYSILFTVMLAFSIIFLVNNTLTKKIEIKIDPASALHIALYIISIISWWH